MRLAVCLSQPTMGGPTSGDTERCLLLCMAYPDISEQYGATVCMAGITEEGEFRRIYPVPFEDFRNTDFHKRHWIEYEIREKGDYRKESYKIRPASVEIGEEVSYEEVGRICEDYRTTIEELNRRQEEDETSLGIVQPTEVYDFTIDEAERRVELAKEYEEQQKLTGETVPINVIPHHTRYHFNCGSNCTTRHQIMCEDIEAGQLYWRLRERYDSIDVVEEKMKEKFVEWMIEGRDLFFMMGTHYRWKSWLIVSVLYPPKREAARLDQWS